MKNTKIKIAVSGDKGSFSEEACKAYSLKNKIDVGIIFATDVKGVFGKLNNKEVDLGLFPVVNSRGCLVKMAFEEIGKHIFEVIDKISIEINQCLISKKNISKEKIKKIATHSQAIKQCQKYINQNFPNIKLLEWQDTAKAVHDLSMGKIEEDVAVIASKLAASRYGLNVLEKNIQDENPNITTFIIIKK